MSTLLHYGLRDGLDPLGVCRDVLQFRDTQFQQHLTDAKARRAQGGKDVGERLAGAIATSAGHGQLEQVDNQPRIVLGRNSPYIYQDPI
jgi:hypothetical protein